MKIKSCEIKNFGKLSDKTVSPADGITVIKGKNESGKSTLCAFIKYILYGFSGKGARDERNNEKLRYTPWSGLKSSGALLLEDENHDLYRAERSSDGRTAKGKILNSGGAVCFEGFDAGEVFYGIDASAFEKSSFVGQNDIEPDDMKDLGTSLQKLIFKGGNDETDFEKAKSTLNSEKNKLYNKMRSTGKIFEIEEKLSGLRLKRISQSESNNRLNAAEFAASEAEKSLALANERLQKLYAEAENMEAYRAGELLEKIENTEREYAVSEEAYRKTLEECTRNGFVPDRKYLDETVKYYSDCTVAIPELKAAKAEYSGALARYGSEIARIHEGNSFDSSVDTDDTKVKELLAKVKMLSESVGKLKKLAVLFLIPVVTIPVSIVLFVLSSKNKKQLSELLSQYGFADMTALEKFEEEYKAVYPGLSKIREELAALKRKADEKENECIFCKEILAEKLSVIGVTVNDTENPDYITDTGKKYIPSIRSDVEKLEAAEDVYLKHKNAYEALVSVSDVEQLRILASKKLPEPPSRPKEEVDRAIKYDEGAKALLEKKLSDNRTEIAKLGAVLTDPADIENEIFALEKELSEAKLHTEALELAMELIEKSGEEIKSSVFPEISARAGELFSKFTGGKYRSLFFDSDFAVKVLEENDAETRKVGYLSSGAADTAYIALRVALAEYLCKNKPTLIFDDSFVKIDDERLSNILNVLIKLSDEYQIIILTCHGREEAILGEKCKVITLDED